MSNTGAAVTLERILSMQPVNCDGTPWDTEISGAMHQKIRREVIAEFKARDTARGLPANGQCTVERDGGWRVDPKLVKLKTTGRETRLTITRRWAEFCAEPKSQAPYAIEVAAIERKADVEAVMAGTAEVADGIGAPAKRKVGRPRKVPVDAEPVAT